MPYPALAQLFVSVLAVSDTGVPDTKLYEPFTVLPAKSCEFASSQLFNGDSETMVNGHRVKIKVRSACVPMPPGPPAEVYVQPQSGGIPPPVAGMIRAFVDGVLNGGFNR